MICTMPKMLFYFVKLEKIDLNLCTIYAIYAIYGFNPRKCSSDSTLSGCIEREMSRVILALPTSNEVVDIIEQMITGRFSSVNNKLAFDTEILLPNLIGEKTEEDFHKDCNYKICYNIRLNTEKEYSTKRVITKILKLEENNQYGYGMTKPLPTGCIKQNSDISWRTFNLLKQNLSLNNNIGHLYVVEIELDHAKTTENQVVYNGIYPPIIEKQKVIDPCERSVYHLLEQYSATEKGNPRTYKATEKAHATTFKKKFQPMYLENFFLLLIGLDGMLQKFIHITYLNKNV